MHRVGGQKEEGFWKGSFFCVSFLSWCFGGGPLTSCIFRYFCSWPSGSNHVGSGIAGWGLPDLVIRVLGMASPDWSPDSRGSGDLGDVPMLEFLLPPSQTDVESDPLATAPGLHQEQREVQSTFPHRSSRRRSTMGERPAIPHYALEHFLGAAPEVRERGWFGDSDKEKVNKERSGARTAEGGKDGSSLKRASAGETPQVTEGVTWSEDMQFIMGPKVASPAPSPLKSILGAKIPSPPSSPLRSLIKPALDIWNWWSNNTESKPLETKGRRADLPALPQKGRGRGNKRKALVHSSLKVKRREALEKDFQARSSCAPKVSRRKTISEFLAADPQAEGSRLNVESLKNLSATLKEGGYKSAVVYLTEAKLVHIEKGWDCTAQLDRYFKLCKRTLERARGPRKKAPEVPVELRKVSPPKEVVWRLKILFAYELFLVATVWMLREIEMAGLWASSFLVNYLDKKVTLVLDTSKTDPESVGVKRTLQCTCLKKACEWDCPFKLTVDLVMKVEKVGGTDLYQERQEVGDQVHAGEFVVSSLPDEAGGTLGEKIGSTTLREAGVDVATDCLPGKVEIKHRGGIHTGSSRTFSGEFKEVWSKQGGIKAGFERHRSMGPNRSLSKESQERSEGGEGRAL